MAEYYRMDLADYVWPISIRVDDHHLRYAGTGFGMERPGLVLTASHVLDSAREAAEVYISRSSGPPHVPASCMKRHPGADIATLVFEGDSVPLCFKLAEPPKEVGQFYLGTEVNTYGYPSRSGGPAKTILEPRLMRGHIQRHVGQEWNGGVHDAFELSFPALPGQSGSPVFLDDDIQSVIAVLTTNFESSVVVDSYEEHQQDGEKEIHKISKVVSYGIGAALWPYADWIRT